MSLVKVKEYLPKYSVIRITILLRLLTYQIFYNKLQMIVLKGEIKYESWDNNWTI